MPELARRPGLPAIHQTMQLVGGYISSLDNPKALSRPFTKVETPKVIEVPSKPYAAQRYLNYQRCERTTTIVEHLIFLLTQAMRLSSCYLWFILWFGVSHVFRPHHLCQGL